MEHLLPYLTALGGLAAFSFSAWKYLDTRRIEARDRRFDQFHRVFAWVAGQAENGQRLVDVQQAIAVYELAEFPEFDHMTVPILQHFINVTAKDGNPVLRRAVEETLARIRKAGGSNQRVGA